MTLWSVKTPVSFGDNKSVTLTRFGTIVITRSSMLLPRVGFSLSCACQEVVVKGFNKAVSSLTPNALSMESQRMSGKLIKVTRNYHIVELVTNFMQKIIEYIHPTCVFIGWLNKIL